MSVAPEGSKFLNQDFIASDLSPILRGWGMGQELNTGIKAIG